MFITYRRSGYSALHEMLPNIFICIADKNLIEKYLKIMKKHAHKENLMKHKQTTNSNQLNILTHQQVSKVILNNHIRTVMYIGNVLRGF